MGLATTPKSRSLSNRNSCAESFSGYGIIRKSPWGSSLMKTTCCIIRTIVYICIFLNELQNILNHYQKHNNLAQRQYKDVSVAEYSNFVAINWGWGGSKDADSNGTIWYNLGSSWYDYNDFKNVVCGFSLLNN